jgi:hypothetical protein
MITSINNDEKNLALDIYIKNNGYKTPQTCVIEAVNFYNYINKNSGDEELKKIAKLLFLESNCKKSPVICLKEANIAYKYINGLNA